MSRRCFRAQIYSCWSSRATAHWSMKQFFGRWRQIAQQSHLIIFFFFSFSATRQLSLFRHIFQRTRRSLTSATRRRTTSRLESRTHCNCWSCSCRSKTGSSLRSSSCSSTKPHRKNPQIRWHLIPSPPSLHLILFARANYNLKFFIRQLRQWHEWSVLW